MRISDWSSDVCSSDLQTLEEWYNDRELYHKIGYLIAIGTNIKNILKEKKEKSKKEFANWINQEIESKFKNVNLEVVEYNGRYVREILLLHNIQRSKERRVGKECV